MLSSLWVSHFAGHTWAALREDGRTVELRVELEGDAPLVGRVVKGRVTKVLPGLQSAFVDIGLDRDAFLHVGDLFLPGEELSPPDPDPPIVSDVSDDEAALEDDEALIATPARRVAPRGPIEDRLRAGRELLVQVARESLGSKGPRVTSFVSLPGRYLVYMPQVAHYGVSRKIEDPAERGRLRAILDGMGDVQGGFIVRTAGAGIDVPALRADAVLLARTWKEILGRAGHVNAPSVVHTDVPLLLRLLRDAPREGLDRIVVEGTEDWERARAYLQELDPPLAARVRLHPGPEPLFQSENLDQDIERALRPRVWLRSGGTLVIEQTEALVSIDVNTGKFVGRGRLEDTVLKTNLEAAEEIARQLRLRDLGGIIVVDFIDMERAESRRRVLETLGVALARDRSRTKVIGLSELGLVQLTRKRTRRGIGAALTRPCPSCAGHGRIKSAARVASEAVAELQHLAATMSVRGATVRAYPDVARALTLELQSRGVSGGSGGPLEVRVEDDLAIPPDQFEILAG